MNSLGISIGERVKVEFMEPQASGIGLDFPSVQRGSVWAWSKDGEEYLVRIDQDYYGWMWLKTEQVIDIERHWDYFSVHLN